jgi:hypothetical protein
MLYLFFSIQRHSHIIIFNYKYKYTIISYSTYININL